MENFNFLVLIQLMILQYSAVAWPRSPSSNIQLLGLFPGSNNDSIISTEINFHVQAMFKTAILLAQQYNITIENQPIGWYIAETNGKLVDALSSTCQAILNTTILGIVGPAFSRETHVIAKFAETCGIPVISYSATDPDLSDRATYAAFYRTVPSDNEAALSVASLFIRFNWTSAVIICQSDVFGTGGAKALSYAFQNNDLTISSTLIFDITKLQFRGDLLKELMKSPARIVICWTESIYASFILQHALDNDVLGPKFTWILRTDVSLSSFDPSSYEKLIGILTIEPTIAERTDASVNSTLLNAIQDIWKQYDSDSFPGLENINYYGLLAFDAAWALIQSLKQLCSSFSCLSVVKSSFCFDYRFRSADVFFDVIETTAFIGVSGILQFSRNITDRVNGSYYLIKNIQLFPNSITYVPVLQWSQSDAWRLLSQRTVIIWPGNTLTKPNGRATLSGVKLRIGVIQSEPFTISTQLSDAFGKNVTKLIGFVPDLIDILQQNTNFIPEILFAPSNQTYDGLIDNVVNGYYDIVIGDVTVTATRREKVDFSNSIFDNALRIIMRKNVDTSVDYLAYLRPFSYGLWILLFLTSIYAGLLICFLERRENEAIQNKSIISSIAMSCWFSIGTIMGYGADFQASTAAGRLITLGLYFLSLVLVATYTANLTSSLTMLKFQSPISGIDDIKNGKIPFRRIGIRVGTSDEDFYLREISGGLRNFYPIKSREEIYDSLFKNIIDVYFMDSGVAEYVTNTIYCNLTVVGAEFNRGVFAIVVPKKWIYTEELDFNILSLRESGVLDDLKQKWFQRDICSDSSTLSTATTVEAMSGLFLTFGMITVLSILLLIWKRRLFIREYLSTHLHRSTSLNIHEMANTEHSAHVSKFSRSVESVLP